MRIENQKVGVLLCISPKIITPNGDVPVVKSTTVSTLSLVACPFPQPLPCIGSLTNPILARGDDGILVVESVHFRIGRMAKTCLGF